MESLPQRAILFIFKRAYISILIARHLPRADVRCTTPQSLITFLANSPHVLFNIFFSLLFSRATTTTTTKIFHTHLLLRIKNKLQMRQVLCGLFYIYKFNFVRLLRVVVTIGMYAAAAAAAQFCLDFLFLYNSRTNLFLSARLHAPLHCSACRVMHLLMRPCVF